jgi:hypothetical protein
MEINGCNILYFMTQINLFDDTRGKYPNDDFSWLQLRHKRQLEAYKGKFQNMQSV